jgi:multicomponent Na+:H+ antiporter subunit F
MFFSGAVAVSYGVLAIALALALVRLIRGPGLPDRVVALDLIGFIAIGFIALTALGTGVAAFLDAAVTLALIAFVASIAFARYLEHRTPNTPASRGASGARGPGPAAP